MKNKKIAKGLSVIALFLVSGFFFSLFTFGEDDIIGDDSGGYVQATCTINYWDQEHLQWITQQIAGCTYSSTSNGNCQGTNC